MDSLGNVIIILVSAMVITALGVVFVFGSGGPSLAAVSSGLTTAPLPEPAGRLTPSPQASAGATLFTFSEAVPGRIVADMTVQRVKPYEGTQASPANVSVAFAGRQTLTGTYYPLTAGNTNTGETCFQPDAPGAAALPQLAGDNRTVWFCFTNTVGAAKLLPGNGRATIVIDGYTINKYPGDIWNTAALIDVVDKQAA